MSYCQTGFKGKVMGMREKLIELVKEMRTKALAWYTAECIADSLIANGVTIPVRCKECKHWDDATVNKKGFLICKASGMEIMATDFCSYGERKEN